MAVSIYLSHHFWPPERERAKIMTKKLEALGFRVVNPFEYKNGEQITNQWFKAVRSGSMKEMEKAALKLVSKDKLLINTCDILVALIPEKTSELGCVGTLMEIIYAYQRFKSVYVSTQKLHPWILFHSTEMFGMDEALIKYLENTWK